MSAPCLSVPKLTATRSFSRGVEFEYRFAALIGRLVGDLKAFPPEPSRLAVDSTSELRFYLPLLRVLCLRQVESIQLFNPSKTPDATANACRLNPACMTLEPVSDGGQRGDLHPTAQG
ncbi:hypothetical protein VTL71DRAFT_8301, partial [Oculimacula yallundae]